MTQTVPGAIEKCITALITRLATHNVTGGKLETIKHIFVGARPLSDTGSMFPAIMLMPKDGASLTPYSSAGYMGQQVLTLPMEIQLRAAALMDTSVNAFANNILFDGLGGGIVPLAQNLLYCLSFDDVTASETSFKIDLDLSLAEGIKPQFRFDYAGNFVDVIFDVTLEMKFVYSEIAGS